MRFLYGQYLYLLPLLLILWIAFFWYIEKRKKGGVRFSQASLLIRIAGNSRRARLDFWIRLLLKSLIFTLLFLALLRPQYGHEKSNVRKMGADIIIILDVSGSMAAEDFKPANRLEAAKEVVSKFINRVSDHRLGMIIFAGVPLTLCPMTLDYGVMIDFLKKIKLNEIPVDGTNIGDALALGVARLKKGSARSKVLILVTDGENNTGKIDPMVGAKLAADEKIKVYTIGIGSKEGAPVPVIDHGVKRYLRDRDGSLYIPKLDEKLLMMIAELTDGKYYRATDTESLEGIFEEIGKLEKSEIVETRIMLYGELFYKFLFVAALLMMLEFLLVNGPMLRTG